MISTPGGLLDDADQPPALGLAQGSRSHDFDPVPHLGLVFLVVNRVLLADLDDFLVEGVGRIALHPDARRKRYGKLLYQAAFDAFDGYESIGCEVNTLPDNPGSHHFHKQMGFKRVGDQTFTPEKAVAYYVRQL